MITSITIKNYKSVENYTLKLQEISGKKCFIFLGRNEAGKSNILKAISLLSPIYTINYDLDCNKKAKRDKRTIRIDFEIDIKFIEILKMSYRTLGLPKELFEKININSLEFSVVGHPSNSITRGFYTYIDSIDLSEYVHDKQNGKVILGSSIGLENHMIDKEFLDLHHPGSYSILTKVSLEAVIEEKYEAKIFEMMPELVFWENSHKYLINEPIDLNLFQDDFTISITLYNIFKLAGVDDVSKRIKVAISEYEERAQLKDELTNAITTHINSTWPEHEINVRIEIEGTMCTVMVEDKDNTLPKYKMEQRSDGFKQFISILLNLSMKSDKPKIIILDEPEVHLHPSGIKYLREELLRISSENIVLISTHSTYMVDKLNIDRHFKVFKEKSLTYIKQLDKDNPYEEEVIYEALGTSIFEHIQPNMILFEGKTDKDIFDAFSNKFKTDIKPLNIGTISTDGVEKIPQYLKFIDNKFIRGFVIIDSDNDGKKIKNHILKDDASTRAYEINDFCYIKEGATLEDLIPRDVISEILIRNYDAVLTLSELPYMKQVNDKNKELHGKINLKDFKSALTNAVLNDLQNMTKPKAKEKYKVLYDYVSNIHMKIKSDIKNN